MIEFHEDAVDELQGLDAPVRSRVRKYITNQIRPLDDPRLRGKPLAGDMLGLWSYRVGDVRIVARIRDGDFPNVRIVAISHRKDVYSRRLKRRLRGFLTDSG